MLDEIYLFELVEGRMQAYAGSNKNPQNSKTTL
jgi:hypothetical protein